MASRCVFSTAVAYTISKVGLVLKKELQTIRNLYNGKDVFLWLPTGLENLYATMSYRFCSTINLAGLGLEIVQC